MQKMHIQPGVETPIVFGDNQVTRRLTASMKEGRVILLDRHTCAVYYRNHSEVCRLKDVNIRRDKIGYYVLI